MGKLPNMIKAITTVSFCVDLDVSIIRFKFMNLLEPSGFVTRCLSELFFKGLIGCC